MRDLNGRVAVVTGAASGIGRAVAIQLATEGCDLAICDVDEAGLEHTANEVRALGREVCLQRVDVAQREQVQRFVDHVVAHYGRVEILVNNAGVTVAAPFEQHTLSDWEWIVGVNLWGVIHGCSLFLPHLKRAGEAHIVNVSSVFGLMGAPGQSAYCATKFAIRGLSEALWTELKSHGIGVTCVHPAAVRTNMIRSARAVDEAAKARIAELIDRKSASPKACARKIVRAIRHSDMRTLDSPAARTIDALKRIAPTGTQRLLESGYRRSRAKA